MIITKEIFLYFFLLFSFDFSRAEVSFMTVLDSSSNPQTKLTLVNKIPTTITMTDHTEELWVYLPRFFPNSGITTNGLYLLYQHDSSFIQLSEAKTETISIFCTLEYATSSNKITITRTGNPVIPKRWTHIAIVTYIQLLGDIQEKSQALYINGIPNHKIVPNSGSNIITIEKYFSVQLFFNIEIHKSKIYLGIFQYRSSRIPRLVESYLLQKL